MMGVHATEFFVAEVKDGKMDTVKAGIEKRQADLDALLRKTVVWKAATPEFMAGYNGFTILTHSGLTTYIEQDEFPELNAAYKKTAWWKATHVQK